ncbi:hypothetical protein ABT115_08885 [Streptomyces sp. NPDC001832]|uniref:hypothetical protein n=1 Tax=Streptomyces sp. NPDC001832 TaxID=3154527 RepID=UPI00332F6171
MIDLSRDQVLLTKPVRRKPIPLWHVYVNGEWLAVEYDGYAPTNVQVGDSYCSVQYRHMAMSCARDACNGLLVWG